MNTGQHYDEAMAKGFIRIGHCITDLAEKAEVLIISDGSTDGTLEAARQAIGSDPRFRVFGHKANVGRGRSRHRCGTRRDGPRLRRRRDRGRPSRRCQRARWWLAGQRARRWPAVQRRRRQRDRWVPR